MRTTLVLCALVATLCLTSTAAAHEGGLIECGDDCPVTSPFPGLAGSGAPPVAAAIGDDVWGVALDCGDGH